MIFGAILSFSALAEAVDAVDLCRPYAAFGRVYGYCIYARADLDQPEAVAMATCAAAGPWQDDCRHAWVQGQLRALGSAASAASLLATCGEDADCRLDVLDALPASDLFRQLDRCAHLAGENRADCGVHAAARWWRSGPSPAEIQRVGQQAHDFVEPLGRYLGAAAACYTIAPCPDAGPVARACASQAAWYQEHPETCPRR